MRTEILQQDYGSLTVVAGSSDSGPVAGGVEITPRIVAQDLSALLAGGRPAQLARLATDGGRGYNAQTRIKPQELGDFGDEFLEWGWLG